MPRKINMLIIEHRATLRKYHAMILRHEGYHVTCASNGRMGLDFFQNIPSDLILLDQDMPGMDGLKILDIITQKTRNLPVLVLWDNPREREIIQAMRMGAWDVLPSPFTKGSLIRAIQMALNRAALLDTNHSSEHLTQAAADQIVHLLKKNRQLIHAKEILQTQIIHAQKMESIALLTGGIAHDFKNILGTIMCSSELLLDIWPKESPYHEDIQRILTVCRHGTHLVNQLLSHARKHPVQRSSLHLSRLVKDMLPLLRAALPSRIALTTQFETEEYTIMGVTDQIQQLILNLVTNALHALSTISMPVLEIRIAEKSSDSDQNQAPLIPPPTKHLVLTIKDNGLGIPQENISRIFTPLFTTKNDEEGTGLGLFIVADIAKRHQATISVRSKEGHGTSFAVTFPIISKKTVWKTTTGKAENSLRSLENERRILRDKELHISGIYS